MFQATLLACGSYVYSFNYYFCFLWIMEEEIESNYLTNQFAVAQLIDGTRIVVIYNGHFLA